jgi:hypothetical protein
MKDLCGSDLCDRDLRGKDLSVRGLREWPRGHVSITSNPYYFDVC